MSEHPFVQAERDLDVCACGDYRFQHERGQGACKLNHLGHGGAPSCDQFKLSSDVVLLQGEIEEEKK